jgi:glutathione-regulated potassium-efflux system ancillary protein KefC/glutathione-regulated potassium-efflux system protein KefB
MHDEVGLAALDPLALAFVFLTATIIAVPLAKRFGLGSVLGYLIAGAVIGPFGLRLLADPEGAMHAAEFGVVIMLFLIGLELRADTLWRMRTAIVGMGGAQVIATSIAGAALGVALGLEWRMALAAGLTLALSSTAIVLQSLRERGLANTDAGRGAFSVLLFQDMAIIPMLALLPLLALAPGGDGESAKAGLIGAWPVWARALAVFAAVGLIVLAGRVALRPLFRIMANTRLQEVFTAFVLAIVTGIALLMQTVGLSAALGAFVAGVVLADSEFRHEIESDIEPFRGVLMGVFFIAVGAAINFALLLRESVMILALVLALVAVKALVMYGVARVFRHRASDSAFMGLSLAQGGEFAFVLIIVALAQNVLSQPIADIVTLIVALTMALTPLLIILGERLMQKLLPLSAAKALEPEIETGEPQVLVAGFGRFGQTVGRLLQANGVRISVIEHDADQVELLRGFGRKVNYGDATRLDLLRLAGADHAQALIIAIDDREKTLALAKTVREHFPHLKVLARAFDRRAVYELSAAQVDGVEREMFEGGVRLGVTALRVLGYGVHRAERAGRLFRRYDERLSEEMSAHWGGDFAAYQRAVRDSTALFEDLMQRDMAGFRAGHRDYAWETKTLEEETRETAHMGPPHID